MQSKTSFFNKTVFKKNLTRFAPMLILYILFLILALVMMYTAERREYVQEFWFASRMAQCIQIMGLVNLFYAPLMAMLLFGDLFTPRMCNALHAMPLRRESWFVTNVLSGLSFSLIPTAIMTVLSIPLLLGTCIHNAWQIGILWFIGTNLEYLCFFGMAVFSVFCTGNRFTMAAIYAALNGGAFLLYMVADTIYTPMLYGVVTSDNMAELLTPMAKILDDTFVEVQNYNEVMRLFRGRESEMVANFWVDENFYNLIAWAIVGVVLMVIGLLLYRKRNLECAGDAVAIRVLKPVFQVACAVAGAALGTLAMEMFFYGYGTGITYLLLLSGLIVGWFGGKMLLERGIRVFHPKNWLGLGVLTVLLAISMGLTHFDVFGIETWVPNADEVKAARIGVYTYPVELTEKEDIENIIKLQEMALEDRLETSGGFPLSYIQSRKEGIAGVTMPSEGFYYGEDGYDTWEEHLYAHPIDIQYVLESGREVSRRYYIWASLEEGDIVNKYLSSWDVIWENARNGYSDPFDLDQLRDINVSSADVPKELVTKEMVESLFAAIQADCEAGTMNPYSAFHKGYFRYEKELEEGKYTNTRGIGISVSTGDEYDTTWAHFDVFADSENTLNWLREHNLLNYEVCLTNAGTDGLWAG